MTLVAGIDSSTQSCKVIVRDLRSGEVVREAAAPHPAGTEIDPAHWEVAAHRAIAEAGGLDDVAAIAVAAQQHGMVCLDDRGTCVRDALLWHDTRSAGAADALIEELDGGAAGWASAVGSVPLASFTVAKLRWLAEHEPDSVARTAMVCLPHDWLTWRLSGRAALEDVVTDRADASGTGYWSPATGDYRTDLFTLALGAERARPRVLQPGEQAGSVGDAVLGPGTGDNAAAALGLGAQPGDVVVSVGTSGVVSTVSPEPTADPSGIIAGFADASGRFLPLVCTLNAVHVLHAAARMLSVSLDTLARLALQAPSGAGGLVLVPYLQGERTPNRPTAAGVLHGLTYQNTTAEHLARAAVEGLLCGLADGLDALRASGCSVKRVLLIGGGAKSRAVREIAPSVFELPVAVPAPGEYVADGAARQAAWTLLGGAEPPTWPSAAVQRFEADPSPQVRARYAEARELTLDRTETGPAETV